MADSKTKAKLAQLEKQKRAAIKEVREQALREEKWKGSRHNQDAARRRAAAEKKAVAAGRLKRLTRDVEKIKKKK